MTVVKPHKGDVAFKIGSKTYVLRYSIDAICVLESLVGKTLIELSADLKDFKTIRMETVRNIFYAGLIEHQKDITIKEAGELIIDAGGSLAVMTKFNEAMSAAYPTNAEASGTPRPLTRRQRRAHG